MPQSQAVLQKLPMVVEAGFESVGSGQAALKRAVEKAYVERSPIKREDKKGRGGSHVTMNYIIPAGKQHLKGLLHG